MIVVTSFIIKINRIIEAWREAALVLCCEKYRHELCNRGV